MWSRGLWSSTASMLACAVLALTLASTASAGSALWIADSQNFQIAEIPASQLRHNTTAKPVVNESAAISSEPWGVCFDKGKNLWVSGDTEQLLKFTSAQLKKLGPSSNSPSPVVTISSSSFIDIVGCTFDSHGNLWVVDAENKSIDEVSAAQLSAGTATITPAVVITDSAEFSDPVFIAFDQSENLWVSDRVADKLFEFASGLLTGGGAKSASITISNNGGSLLGNGELAFDSQGNLWVPNESGPTVVMFSKSDLAMSGSPAPAVTLSSAALNGPFSLAFQGSNGPLWVLDENDNKLFKFLPSQIKSSGAPTPKVTVQNAANEAWQITFGPEAGKPGDKN